MPEGPSLVILREESSRFVGKKIARAEGNTKALDLDSLAGQEILSMRTFGKQFLIELPDLAIRVHFLLFGSYRIDERRPDRVPRLSLGFDDGSELHFYACSVRKIDNDLDAAYDWSADVMSPTWDAAKARKKLRAEPDMLTCDALLDQDIFAGVRHGRWWNRPGSTVSTFWDGKRNTSLNSIGWRTPKPFSRAATSNFRKASWGAQNAAVSTANVVNNDIRKFDHAIHSNNMSHST